MLMTIITSFLLLSITSIINIVGGFIVLFDPTIFVTLLQKDGLIALSIALLAKIGYDFFKNKKEENELKKELDQIKKLINDLIAANDKNRMESSNQTNNIERILDTIIAKLDEAAELKEENDSLSDEKRQKTYEKMDEVYRKIVDLYSWHNITDNDGVKVWYIRNSLVQSIIDILHKTDANGKEIEKIKELLEDLLDKKRGH